MIFKHQLLHIQAQLLGNKLHQNFLEPPKSLFQSFL